MPEAALTTTTGAELDLMYYKRIESQDKLDFLFRRDCELLDLSDVWLRRPQKEELPDLDRTPFEDLLDLNTEDYDTNGPGLAEFLRTQGEVRVLGGLRVFRSF